MKTAISLPDDLFEEAERVAKRLKKTRSELYREAVAEYVAKHDSDVVTAAMDEVLEKVGAAPDPFVEELAHRSLERSEW